MKIELQLNKLSNKARPSTYQVTFYPDTKMMSKLPSQTQTLLRMQQTSSFIGVYITIYEMTCGEEKTRVAELVLRPMLYQNSHEALQKVAFLNQNHVYGKANVYGHDGVPKGLFRWKSMTSIFYEMETVPAEMIVRSGQDIIDIYLLGPVPEYARDFGEQGDFISC